MSVCLDKLKSMDPTTNGWSDAMQLFLDVTEVRDAHLN